jgi:TATA-binding protein-associated factor
MLRRTKTEVLSDLPPKIIQDHYCDLSDVQVALYNDYVSRQSDGIKSSVQVGTLLHTHQYPASAHLQSRLVVKISVRIGA